MFQAGASKSWNKLFPHFCPIDPHGRVTLFTLSYWNRIKLLHPSSVTPTVILLPQFQLFLVTSERIIRQMHCSLRVGALEGQHLHVCTVNSWASWAGERKLWEKMENYLPQWNPYFFSFLCSWHLFVVEFNFGAHLPASLPASALVSSHSLKTLMVWMWLWMDWSGWPVR